MISVRLRHTRPRPVLLFFELQVQMFAMANPVVDDALSAFLSERFNLPAYDLRVRLSATGHALPQRLTILPNASVLNLQHQDHLVSAPYRSGAQRHPLA